MGAPRSGTTLATAIVDGLENSFALSEPPSHLSLAEASRDPRDFVCRLQQDLAQVRNDLASQRPVEDRRNADGTPLTDYLQRSESGSRLHTALVPVRRTVGSSDLLVAAKHNALYLSVLPELCESRLFKILAVVRNPVRTLESWQSVPMPIAQGRLPAGERFWAELSRISAAKEALLDKQARILNLIFERILDAGDAVSCLKYEQVCSTPIIQTTLGRSMKRPVEIRHAASSVGVDAALVDSIRDAILRCGPSLSKLYPD